MIICPLKVDFYKEKRTTMDLINLVWVFLLLVACLVTSMLVSYWIIDNIKDERGGNCNQDCDCEKEDK